jgi:Domain of unknown function (DUF4111)/Nucleotidyltransferase domain
MTTDDPEASYLSGIALCLRELFGEELVGVYGGGSYALGDYRRGMSDLDVAAVIRGPMPTRLRALAVERLLRAAARCPTRGLELVVYRSKTAGSGAVTADFELNLNAGPEMQSRVEHEPPPGEEHWFAIDRSVLAQAGIAVLGPPAGHVFRPITPKALAPVLIASVRWHRAHLERPEDAVLNACRSLRFVAEGRWYSKPAAGQWAAKRGLASTELVERACAGEVHGDLVRVHRFLTDVVSRLAP